jgi:hypothetical protein
MPLPLTLTLVVLAFVAAIIGDPTIAYVASGMAIGNEGLRMFTLAPQATRPVPPGVRQRTPYNPPEE